MMKQLIPFPKENRAPLLCCSHGKSWHNLEGKRSHSMCTEQASSPMKSLSWCWGSKGAVLSRCPGCCSSPASQHCVFTVLCKQPACWSWSQGAAQPVQGLFAVWTVNGPASQLRVSETTHWVLHSPACTRISQTWPRETWTCAKPLPADLDSICSVFCGSQRCLEDSKSQKVSPCFLSQVPTAQLKYKVWILTTSLTAVSVQTCSEHQTRLSHSGGCAQGTHAVSLSWQVSPELAEIYFLSTGLTCGSPEGVCVEAFCVEAFIPISGWDICIMTCYRYSAAGVWKRMKSKSVHKILGFQMSSADFESTWCLVKH